MASKKELSRTSPWIAVGISLLVAGWFAACAAAFWFIYSALLSRMESANEAVSALQWMTWPFTILAISGPIVVILAIGGLRVVRDLLDMRDLIEGLPAQANLMQKVLSDFQEVRAQLITDQSRLNADDAPEGEDEADEVVGEAPHVREFMELYRLAKKKFYAALQAYNATADEPLIVKRGGGNFAAIAEELRIRRGYPGGNRASDQVGEWVVRVFAKEKATRASGRDGLKSEDVRELQRDAPK